MKLSEIIGFIEAEFPLSYQEKYDNSGLAVGDPEQEITGALLCIDVTPDIVDEAIKLGVNLIISHHPLIFQAIKQITEKNYTEKIISKVIRNQMAVYSMHTNLDNIISGVNQKICSKLGLINCRILAPLNNSLKKLVTYVPNDFADKVRNALFEAGAGHIGNYDSCSYNLEGKGTFRPQKGTNPFSGDIGKLNFEQETRIETIFPEILKSQIIKALLINHPYEEVAFDIYPVENSFGMAGAGMIGELDIPKKDADFLHLVKTVFKCRIIRSSQLPGKTLHKIAVCGGSGAFLIPSAISAGADLFLTGEMKYHQFFDSEDKIVLADMGHYESEQFTTEIFYDILKKNLPNFAIHFSSINSNPIYYLL